MLIDDSDLSPLEGMQIATMVGVTAFWVFCFGAALGSFLNVVVYRLPRRMTLVRTPSACPNCGQAIAVRDNVPIFGWLKLRGRCRVCAWAIPIRYPLVELVVAGLFVALLFIELTSGGTNLPVREPEHYAGVVWTVWYFKYPDLIQFYFFHGLLLYLSLGMMLIALDHRPVPGSLLYFGIAVGIVWLAIEPRLHPTLGFWQTWNRPTWSQRVAALLNGIWGMLLGGLVGTLLARFGLRQHDLAERSALAGILLMCGLYLGPTTVVSVTCMTLLMTEFVNLLGTITCRQKPFSLATSAAVAVCLQCLAWRQLTSINHWPSHHQPWTYHAVILILAMAVANVTQRRIRLDSSPGNHH